MTLLSAHLEQISISCQGIDSLPFPPPKIFTNALLSSPDITSLIRDTEAHERALFSVPPPPPPATAQPSRGADADADAAETASRRRQTVFNVTGGEVTTGPPANSTRGAGAGAGRRSTAVAAVLGGDLHAQIVRRGRGSSSSAGASGGSAAAEVDIGVLLRGAEKLCAVYALPGALERIPELRAAHAEQSETLAYFEGKVAEQQEALKRMNAERAAGEVEEEEEEEEEEEKVVEEVGMTEEDLRREEEEVRQLEKRKRELQARLRALDSDLGGLLNV